VARNHDGRALPAADSSTQRTLVFRLDEKLHALRVSDISGVVSCDVLRRLPGAPAGLRGLAEWRGSVLSVLDLPRYLGRTAKEEPACLVRLAPPLEQTALYVPATVQLTEDRLEPQPTDARTGAESGWLCAGEPVYLVDPSELVSRLEAEIRESG